MTRRLRPELAATLWLALPLICSHLARVAIGVTDTIMVGRYDGRPLAALILANACHYILVMLGSGFALGVMGVIATALARDDQTEVRRATRMALWLSGAHAAVVLPLLWWSGPVLIALGQEADLAALAQQWLRIMALAVPAILWGMTLNSFLAALGRPNIVMLITVAGLPVNALLNWLLVWGHGPFPELGVRGSAIASLSVNWLQLAALAACAAGLPVARPFHLFQRLWRADPAALRRVFTLGLPIGLTLVAETGMFSGTNVLMGWFGAPALAAHGIALQIASLTFMVHLGLSNAATIRVGGAAGAGDAAGMRRAGVAAILLSAVFALLAMTMFLALPGRLTALYLNPADPLAPQIVALAASLMLYAGMFQLFDAMQAIAMGLLRGVQDTRVPMALAVVSYWLAGVPAGYWLAFPGGFGPSGLWMGLVIGLVCAAVLLMARFWRRGASWWCAGPLARTAAAG